MFLDLLRARNPALARAGVRLHQGRSVRAGTYLLDVDTMAANARILRQVADANGLGLYFMSKQFGRNPDACRAISAAGIEAAVAVDIQCMEAVQRSGTRIGHVGHLVQPHRGAENAVIAANPEVVTVFSLDVAERLAAASVRAGRTQPVLLRVIAPGDRFYFGHGGGFALAEIVSDARRIDHLPGLRVEGVTTFPCMLPDPETGTVRPTTNFTTLRTAADRLRAAGFEIGQVNAPGTNSAATMAALAAGGATHAEPGSALHGTTPMDIWDPDAPEAPAIVLVSEVSHLEGDDAYVFAAGIYIDKVAGEYGLRALCGRDDSIVDRVFPVELAPDGAIHYYGKLHLPGGHDVRVGDTVVFCFRPQVFVTRGRTRAVFEPGSDTPRLGVAYDAEARPVEGVS